MFLGAKDMKLQLHISVVIFTQMRTPGNCIKLHNDSEDEAGAAWKGHEIAFTPNMKCHLNLDVHTVSPPRAAQVPGLPTSRLRKRLGRVAQHIGYIVEPL